MQGFLSLLSLHVFSRPFTIGQEIGIPDEWDAGDLESMPCVYHSAVVAESHVHRKYCAVRRSGSGWRQGYILTPMFPGRRTAWYWRIAAVPS
ncbi:hypothetical protein F5Y10DRAFT_230682 [Nemania abortiva]|nr:hypothetical protein F5Y10DRAFT_230682 [Nemania abortiva]